MLIPHEIASKFVLPTLRSNLSIILVNNFGVSQQKTALLLGVTQASISHYLCGNRAQIKLIDDPEINSKIMDLAKMLVSKPLTKQDLMTNLSNLCNYIMTSKLMCDIHAAMDPEMDISCCDACNELIVINNKK